MSQARCRSCGEPIALDEPVPRDAECPSCGHDVRCCANCRHYDVRYNNSCRETMADPVEDKQRRNFCEYFQLSREPWKPAAGGGREREARAKLESLFGGPRPPGDRAAEARKKLERLFGERPEPSDDA